MRILIVLCLVLAVFSCKLEIPETDLTQFSPTPTTASVSAGRIDNVSGMADSRSQPDNIWIVQGSGSPAALTLLGHDGTIKGTLDVPRFSNRDWADLAIGPGPNQGTNYLYIADIGDRNLQSSIYQIYRLPEPSTLQTAITQIERINFRYPDGPQDARAMFVDALSGDIFIVTNRVPNARLYRIAYPQNIDEIAIAEAFGEIPVETLVTGAAASSDGREVVLRTYSQGVYWKRAVGQTFDDAMQKSNSRPAPLVAEPRGEAICFDKDGSGYFTISQKTTTDAVNLYYFGKQ
ncbi:PE-PGRS family protein [Spirosoma agri]|uniref:PE-PGRS family protein n=1 Tax=Spirosoma agri TaxID=1987381 RepID=A0A6M0IFN1_9BACT|nr:PE-PGRS family protein [Spirosoma agri]NEU66938.1 PE-PGRS family protein [Spirosoma agri]